MGKEKYEQAQNLRRKGLTYSEIGQQLKVSKSTLSYWLRDIDLSSSSKLKLKTTIAKNLEKARVSSLKKRKELFTGRLLKLEEENEHLLKLLKSNKNVQKIVLSILYFGEGSKWRGHRGLMLGSSTPDLLRLYINLLSLVYNISSDSLRARISYRADQDIKKLTDFWSRELKMPKSNFYNTVPDSRTIGKPTKNHDYKGVCVITCAGTNFQLELEAITRVLARGL